MGKYFCTSVVLAVHLLHLVNSTYLNVKCVFKKLRSSKTEKIYQRVSSTGDSVIEILGK